MQIDGSHFSALYAPKPLFLEQTKRAPITIDAEKFTIDEQPKRETVRQDLQTTNEVKDSQQARFVRLFSSTSEPSSNEATSPAQALPKGVQHYLQIDQLTTPDEQPLLDELI